MKDSQIVQTAIENFRPLVGDRLSINFLPRAKQTKDNEGEGCLEIGKGRNKMEFYVEVKHEVRQTNLADILIRFENHKHRWILVSNYIPMPLKVQFKQLGVNYLESSGNCFIAATYIFYSLTVRRLPQFGLGAKENFGMLRD